MPLRCNAPSWDPPPTLGTQRWSFVSALWDSPRSSGASLLPGAAEARARQRRRQVGCFQQLTESGLVASRSCKRELKMFALLKTLTPGPWSYEPFTDWVK